jgi:hypothetical protein
VLDRLAQEIDTLRGELTAVRAAYGIDDGGFDGDLGKGGSEGFDNGCGDGFGDGFDGGAHALPSESVRDDA